MFMCCELGCLCGAIEAVELFRRCGFVGEDYVIVRALLEKD
jgi:hypothetical protein